ncbi:MAG: hypothetical protein M3347_09940 [Armatimonadota bacterium]|nr:hypothetical protein [Armatimonadota bacterium]
MKQPHRKITARRLKQIKEWATTAKAHHDAESAWLARLLDGTASEDELRKADHAIKLSQLSETEFMEYAVRRLDELSTMFCDAHMLLTAAIEVKHEFAQELKAHQMAVLEEEMAVLEEALEEQLHREQEE